MAAVGGRGAEGMGLRENVVDARLGASGGMEMGAVMAGMGELQGWEVGW